MMMTPIKSQSQLPSDVYKTLSIALGSIIVTLIGAYLMAARNAVTKDELPGLIQQYSPYTADSKDIKAKLDELRDAQIKTTEQLHQVQIDTARIGEKLGVTASPGVALRNR
jgi:hypothetical protein